MLDAQTIATVKATIPLLVETGPKLTAHFYDRMFTHNPELKEIFNMSNQRNGDQREALFNAIALRQQYRKFTGVAAGGRKNRAEAHQLPD